MKKTKLNYLVDLCMGLCFLVVAITGVIIFLFLPSGIRRGGYQQFWGITKQNWENIHDWAGIILLIFIVLHLILHWSWIVSMTKALFRENNQK